MRSHIENYLLIVIGAVCSLFISFWFSAYAIALVQSFLLKLDVRKTLLSHFLIYSISAMVYCAVTWSTGSQKLIHMIGEIFLGSSPVVLMIISSVFFGITALLGSWSGWALRTIVRGAHF